MGPPLVDPTLAGPVAMGVRMVSGQGAARLITALCAALLVACGDVPDGDRTTPAEGPPVATPSTGTPSTETPTPETPSTEAAPDQPTAAARDSLRSAFRSLVAGPSAAARAQGADSWFSEETSGVLQSVEVDSGRVVVDFSDALPGLIPGAGSSAGSEALLVALDSTLFQFPWVKSGEYRLNGSCAAFWEWLQRECTVVKR